MNKRISKKKAVAFETKKKKPANKTGLTSSGNIGTGPKRPK
jgi:hypothetical protein